MAGNSGSSQGAVISLGFNVYYINFVFSDDYYYENNHSNPRYFFHREAKINFSEEVWDVLNIKSRTDGFNLRPLDYSLGDHML